MELTEKERAYVAAVQSMIEAHADNEDASPIFPWLTTRCPECDESHADAAQKDAFEADHYMIGQAVIIGCEGYSIINPNVIGIDRPNWQDWK